jgi:hypothetical protein
MDFGWFRIWSLGGCITQGFLRALTYGKLGASAAVRLKSKKPVTIVHFKIASLLFASMIEAFY